MFLVRKITFHGAQHRQLCLPQLYVTISKFSPVPNLTNPTRGSNNNAWREQTLEAGHVQIADDQQQ
jgi:hypothetical protein